ncbi:DUF4148 domain-containing protein [Paraburkholderia hospita]|jgi:hypothetical protein|uniref:DUF4148 domain-containing protein n=1 Tax=Paraburkholderia hospita TaxID=169430 RepID=UPI000271D82E|nr:DUF4148 domain-containing protein [Paraburkholderia hospita]EUC13950.1 Protein of unknown function DUF4148 [Burkholderia sp. BT03]SKC91169.1 protein of unknown function [Paraburkholderia hospita]
MKSLIKAVALAAIILVPVASFAQSNGGVTRAQVRAELVQLEKAGYNPATSNPDDYPQNIQAAEAKVAAQNGDASGYGSAAKGSNQSGHRVAADSTSPHSIYFGN